MSKKDHVKFKALKQELKKPQICFLYGLFLVLMLLVIGLKSNYHEDEGYTYGSSNSVAQQAGGYAFMEPQNGVRYDAAEEPFREYAAVTWGNNFHFATAWKNQYSDVHPPFYYLIVHFVSSFFPGVISKWIGGGINIVFALMLLWICRKLMDVFTKSENVKFAVSLALVTCSGILSLVTFFRMYILLMVEITAFVYLLLTKMQDGAPAMCSVAKQESTKGVSEKKATLCWCGKLGLLTLVGALTHYYFILFVVFFCVFYGIALLLQKQFGKVLPFAASVLVGGGLSYLLFPQMLEHMFSGSRGSQAVENFNNTADLWSRIKVFFEVTNYAAFGGLLAILLVGLLIYFLLEKADRLPTASEDGTGRLRAMGVGRAWSVGICLLSCSIFFLFVAKMAPYQVSRYVSPIFPLLMVVVLCLAFDLPEQALGETGVTGNASRLVTALLLAIMVIGSFTHTSWEFLYLEERPSLSATEEYAACDAVCIYDQNWKLFNGYKELSRYNSLTFYKEGTQSAEAISQVVNTPVMVVSYMSYTSQKEIYSYFQYLVEEMPEYSTFEVIGSFKYSVTAIFY